MDEYETEYNAPDTTREFEELTNVSGAYNLPRHERQRHSYDYYSKALINSIEQEAKERYNTARGMQTLRGPEVSKHITQYYLDRGFPAETAQHIAQVRAGVIHRSHLLKQIREVKRMARNKMAREKGKDVRSKSLPEMEMAYA
jgi:hypothetical protein